MLPYCVGNHGHKKPKVKGIVENYLSKNLYKEFHGRESRMLCWRMQMQSTKWRKNKSEHNFNKPSDWVWKHFWKERRICPSPNIRRLRRMILHEDFKIALQGSQKVVLTQRRQTRKGHRNFQEERSDMSNEENHKSSSSNIQLTR